MRMMSSLRRLLFPGAGEKPTPDSSSGNIEDLMNAGQRRWNETDPETQGEWRRLEILLRASTSATTPVAARPRRSFTRPAISFAVAVVVLIVVGIVWLQGPTTQRYETARGEHSTIHLADSTDVTLNHTSELIVHSWTRNNPRLVDLHGEAFFHVRRTGTPFMVETKVGTVRVLGTEFNVRVRDNTLEVGVLSGRVEVKVTKGAKDSSVVMEKGQILTCDGGTYPGLPGPLLLSDFPAWMHGKFTFYRSELGSVCRELEAQFDVPVRIENPRLLHETITGTIDGRTIESALTTLTALTGCKYRHEKSSFTLY